VKLLLAILVALCISITASAAFAGGGPENVLLLVNSNSDASKTIANNYINWRQIPASNVLYIDWKGPPGIIGGEAFRETLLVPTLLALEERHLASQVDYIVYSSDFPWRVDLRDLFRKDQQFPPELEPSASLNGATYLAPFVLAQNPAIVNPDINWYVPGLDRVNIEQCHNLADVSTRAFRWRYSWDKDGKKTNGVTTGQRYLLSTVLGFTRGRGNTVDEVLSYLRRSVLADGTRPNGTIYFMWNKDVRSSTRDKCFPAVAAQINKTGAHAVVQQGRIPTGAKDVAGMMVGAADFSLAKEGVKILPGAICEHLTSEGGIINPASQTPLSEFLRAGAAGASGTVVEPRALQAKFPLPSIQLHYVRGCSLAEAFYQSISGPYQLLIVGDPLCQPWAAIPKINVAGVTPHEKVKGALTLTPSGPNAVGTYELYVDGRLTERTVPGKPLPLDTTQLADGYHELRVVGIRSDPIETQGRAVVPIFVNNHEAIVELKVSPATPLPLSAKLKVSVRQPGATSITIRQNSRDLGRVKGESGDLEILAATLGRGPTTLQAISEGKAAAASVPVRILVE
jgi:hypothetical protein